MTDKPNTLEEILAEFGSFWTAWRLDWLLIENHSNESQEDYAKRGLKDFIRSTYESGREAGLSEAKDEMFKPKNPHTASNNTEPY